MDNVFSVREKAILIGLYLSKFDTLGLHELGFDSAIQAFNVFGYSIGVKPASIKNYRDEFDPYFPNQRKGWHKRELRDYCSEIMLRFESLNFNDFTRLIKNLTINNYEIEKFVKQFSTENKTEESVAKRLLTGKAAEEYFKKNYLSVPEFIGHGLFDATNLACGFDFKTMWDNEFYCVEVKGLNLSYGNIMMTEKEFVIARELKWKYCLFVVANFAETPYHKLYFNPVDGRLDFQRVERKVIQTSYVTSI
ncbi:MAG: DUF3883 domain-containing protein [Treponema sp.]|jgi:hypothetical protein|nr:DUF3883 domain-containing protein [Treponema sp.]